MTPQQAAEILRKYQTYRYGKSPYEAPGAKFEHPTREITKAIDEAIGALEHLADFDKFHKEMTK